MVPYCSLDLHFFLIIRDVKYLFHVSAGHLFNSMSININSVLCTPGLVQAVVENIPLKIAQLYLQHVFIEQAFDAWHCAGLCGIKQCGWGGDRMD